MLPQTRPRIHPYQRLKRAGFSRSTRIDENNFAFVKDSAKPPVGMKEGGYWLRWADVRAWPKNRVRVKTRWETHGSKHNHENKNIRSRRRDSPGHNLRCPQPAHHHQSS